MDRNVWCTGLQALMRLQHLAYVLDIEFARRGQPQAPGKPLEDRNADLLFQRDDLPVDGRGGHVEPAGRLPDRAAAGDLVDISQLAGMKHRPPLPIMRA